MTEKWDEPSPRHVAYGRDADGHLIEGPDFSKAVSMEIVEMDEDGNEIRRTYMEREKKP